MRFSFKNIGRFIPSQSPLWLVVALGLMVFPIFGERHSQLLGLEDYQHEMIISDLFNQLREAPNQITAEAIEIKLYSELVKSGSVAIDILMNDAYLDAEHGDIQSAYATLRTITIQAPMYPEGFNRLANICFQLNLKDEAYENLKKTIALEPRHFAAWAGLGAIYEERGDYENALKAYKNAQYYNPNLDEANRGVFATEAKISGIIM